MTAPSQYSSGRPGRVLLVSATVFTAVILFWFLRGKNTPAPIASSTNQPSEILRSELVLNDGRLCRLGTSNAFTGLMLERYPDGNLRSRTAVSNGLLHGVSEGWHTNGTLQVTEHFTNGVSHGIRVKWHPNGVKASEAQVVDGKLHGLFVSWHDNGAKAAEIELKHGQPDGESSAYYSSGALKSRVTLRDGKVLERKEWRDGELAQANPLESSLR